MKTKLNKTSIRLQKLSTFFVAILFMALYVNCSKDDSGTNLSITAKTSTSTFDVLNTCDIGGCCLATEFDFTITYEASEGVTINKILFDLEWSNGDIDSSETIEFKDMGTNIIYDWCYRFAGDEWVEITHRLVTEQGITSNPSIIKVFKPQDAN